MKRALFVLGAAILFVSTLVTPTVVRADGGSGNGTGCNGLMCKP